MTRGISALVLMAVAGAACIHRAAPAEPQPKNVTTKARGASPPAEWYWEPVEAVVRTPARPPLDLPALTVARPGGAAKIWDGLDPDVRERLRRDGVVVLGSEPPSLKSAPDAARTIGAFYTRLREERVPAIITLAALYAALHAAMERALADVEALELAPTVLGLLEKLEERLGRERMPPSTELSEAHRMVRGVVAVARSLAGLPYAPPAELAAAVAAERARVEGHAALEVSPMLGIPIDYARFEVPSSAARPGLFRSLAWLGVASFPLVARSEVPGTTVNVAQARLSTRAAMMLARLCDRDVDPVIHASYARVLRLLAFVWGAPDDLSLTETDDVATAAGIDIRDFQAIANVARVDEVRARAREGRAPQAFDAAGAVGRAGIAVRMFGGHAAPDSLVLQRLVGSTVGALREPSLGPWADRVRDGQRVVPSTLDVVAWLGAREARTVLHESYAEGFETYDEALASLQRTRPGQGSALHASIHGSLVDSLIAWGTAETRPSSSPLERARIESILAAWTLVRHSGQVMSRTQRPLMPSPTELTVSGSPQMVFVEPLPDVVARLVATTRQLRRGLEALGSLPAASSAMLVELEAVFRTALVGAERQASDEVLSTEETFALASLPTRLARFDEAEASEGGPVIATVYSDPKSKRVLASATGDIEPVLMLVRDRDRQRDEPLLVVGAHLAHHELVEGFATAPGVIHGIRPALTDHAWRLRLRAIGPPRAAWTSSFRWTPSREEAPASTAGERGTATSPRPP